MKKLYNLKVLLLTSLLGTATAQAQTCQNDGQIWGVESSKQVDIMDPTTGTVVLQGTATGVPETYLGDLAWGYDNQLYAVGFNGGGGTAYLYRLDSVTYAATQLTPINGASNALGSLPNGQLLLAAYSSSNSLPTIYSYDLTNPSAGLKPWYTFSGGRSAGDIAFLNGKVYVGWSDGVSTYVYAFNVDSNFLPTGAPTIITTVPGADKIFGIVGLNGRLFLTLNDSNSAGFNNVREVDLTTGQLLAGRIGVFDNPTFGLAAKPQAYGGTCLPPLAQPNTGTVTQNLSTIATKNSVTVNVLANDSAQTPGNFLRPNTVIFTASGQPAGSVITQGGKVLTNADGVYRINADGTVTFTPADGQPSGTKAPVTYQVSDSNYKTVTSTLTITVNPLPSNLKVSKVGTPFVDPGGTVSYTIRVWNEGPAPLNGTVSDPVPVLTGVTWTCTGTAGASCSAASGSDNPSLTVQLSPDAATTTGPDTVYATMTVTGTAPSATTLSSDPAARSWTNTVTVSSPTDSDPSDNSASATTQTIYPTLSKRVRNVGAAGNLTPAFGTSISAYPGDLLEYCVDASNLGSAPLNNFQLADGIQSHQTFQSGTVQLTGSSAVPVYDGSVTTWDQDGRGPAAPIAVNGLLSANIGTLASGQQVSLCFRTRVN